MLRIAEEKLKIVLAFVTNYFKIFILLTVIKTFFIGMTKKYSLMIQLFSKEFGTLQ
jgi:hypothetical protein